MTKVHFNYVYDSIIHLIIHHWSANRNHLNTTFIWFRSVSWFKQQQPKATWRGSPWSWEGRTRASCLLTVTVSQGWSFWGRRSWIITTDYAWGKKKHFLELIPLFSGGAPSSSSIVIRTVRHLWESGLDAAELCLDVLKCCFIFYVFHFSLLALIITFPGTSFTFLIALTSLHVAKKPLLCGRTALFGFNCCTLLISVWTRNGIWDVSLSYSEP